MFSCSTNAVHIILDPVPSTGIDLTYTQLVFDVVFLKAPVRQCFATAPGLAVCCACECCCNRLVPTPLNDSRQAWSPDVITYVSALSWYNLPHIECYTVLTVFSAATSARIALANAPGLARKHTMVYLSGIFQHTLEELHVYSELSLAGMELRSEILLNVPFYAGSANAGARHRLYGSYVNLVTRRWKGEATTWRNELALCSVHTLAEVGLQWCLAWCRWHCGHCFLQSYSARVFDCSFVESWARLGLFLVLHVTNTLSSQMLTNTCHVLHHAATPPDLL